MLRIRSIRIAVRAAALTAALACSGAELDVLVQMSNGEDFHGRLETLPNPLQLSRDSRIYEIPWEQAVEIRIQPDSERMVQQWRFAEPGQVRKIRWGAPYPVRTMLARVELSDGTIVTGRPSATALHLRDETGVRKVLLLSKQSGKPGETLDQLVFPVRIALSGGTPPGSRRVTRIEIPAAFTSVIEVVSLSHDSLIRTQARRENEPGTWSLPEAGFSRQFLAVRGSAGITAGWRDSDDLEIRALVEDALLYLRDFFDESRLLGVHLAPDGETVYSLILQIRRGGTTLDGKRNRPWRLAIIRWKLNREDASLMSAGAGYFFRGPMAADEQPPAISLSRELWQ